MECSKSATYICQTINNNNMYTQATTIETFKKNEKVISIIRVQKQGTTRVFFFPKTVEGLRLNRTMYAAKWEAVKIAKMYLNN